MKMPISLTQISVANPCPADWNAMAGDGQQRFCPGCQKHVHNLSAMTQSEAERLLCESSGRLCVRYEPAADGLPKTLDYAAPNATRRGWKFWTIVTSALASIVTGLHAIASPPVTPRVVMGVLKPIALPATQPSPSTQPAVLGKVAVRPIMGEVAAPATQPTGPVTGGIACPTPTSTTEPAE